MTYSHQLLSHPVVTTVHESIKNDMFKWILKPYEYDYSKFDTKWITVFPGPVFTNVLKTGPELQVAVSKGLKEKYDSRVAELFYTKLNNDQ